MFSLFAFLCSNIFQLRFKGPVIVPIIKFLEMWWSLIRCDRKWNSDASLTGKTVIITGGNAGIGKETVRGLAVRGAKVIIACRDTARGEEAAIEIIADIKKEFLFEPNIIIKHLNLASFSSVRKFAEEVLDEEEHIHILINNAGVAGCPRWKTEDGYEMQFGVNHLGHFLLTLLLIDRLKASSPARIVNVSSIAHHVGEIHFDDINLEKNYEPLKAYKQSKLANILFTRELSRRLEGSGVTVYSLHPGVIHSGLGRHMGDSMGRFTGRLYNLVSYIFFKNVKKGAQTTLYCAIEESLSNESGCYYSGCRKVEPSRRARDDQTAKDLWELSEKLTGMQL